MRDISTTSIQYLKGVGPSKKKLFTRLGVESVEDALYLFPRRYEDRRAMTTIAQARVGEWQTIAGVVTQYDSRRAWYTKKHVCEVAIEDETGRLWGVWFNQPYISTYFSNGQQVVFYGKVDRYKDRLQMVAPEYEIIGEDSEEKNLSTGRATVKLYGIH